MSNLSFLASFGIKVSISTNGRLKLSGLSKIPPNDVDLAIRYAKKHKNEILTDLKSVVGQCETCPAGGYWDFHGPGMWCFHSAYFLGKAAQPIPCETVRGNCPLLK